MASFRKTLGKKLSELKEKDVKCVFLGDSAVGKTKLICSYVYNHPKRDIEFLIRKRHMPSIFAFDSLSLASNKRIRFIVGKRAATLHIWDTFGDHEKDREYSCKNADVIIICYNIGSKSSFRNVYSKWYSEVLQYCPNVPIILVGTQADRRHNDACLYKPKKSQYFSLHEYLHHEHHELSPAVSNNSTEELVEASIARMIARNINAVAYVETSVATKHGVNELFRKALKIGLAKKLNRLDRVMSDATFLQKPYRPPCQRFPQINIPIINVEKWYKFSPSFSDVNFVFEEITLKCHKVILAMNSKFFFTLFQLIKSNASTTCLPKNFQNITFSNGILTFHLADINPEHFEKIIKSFYNDGFLNVENMNELEELQATVQLLNLSSDIQYVLSRKDDNNNGNLNEEFPIFLNDPNKREKKLNFVNNEFLSDCQIRVDNTLVHAHRCVLASRCDVLAAMLKGESFIEGHMCKVDFQDTTLESFLALLEFLYTGNCGYYGDLHGTLQLANFLCLPRLIALCEQEIVKYIKEMDTNSDKDVYSAVLASYQLAQFHNAPQLSAWCLHFMTVNYNAMCKEQGREMKMLEPSCLKSLEEKRWPPVWYLKEQDYYERSMEQIEKVKTLKKNKKRRKYHTCFH